ncbi:PREDICTED: acidic repeat-containing protein [Chinchilla lanigera]|uniref:acidic repeat-containing protein n=1 Tax=Chinchilla lanigera TaxID=34839 RepID=UPI00038EEB0B|nr:PREDICTED: acidic repeat-containing protein [Chinchilla lanigera]
MIPALGTIKGHDPGPPLFSHAARQPRAIEPAGATATAPPSAVAPELRPAYRSRESNAGRPGITARPCGPIRGLIGWNAAEVEVMGEGWTVRGLIGGSLSEVAVVGGRVAHSTPDWWEPSRVAECGESRPHCESQQGAHRLVFRAFGGAVRGSPRLSAAVKPQPWEGSGGRAGAGGEMDKPEEEPGPSDRLQSQDDCYIVSEPSSESGKSESTVVRKGVKKREMSPVILSTSESDDEYDYEEKRMKMYEINSEDEILEVISDSDDDEQQQPTTSTMDTCPVVISDDEDDNGGNDNKMEIPELKEGDSQDPGQICSDKGEVDQGAASQQSSPGNILPAGLTCEQSSPGDILPAGVTCASVQPDNVPSDNVHEKPDLGENLDQPPNDPEGSPQTTDEKLPATEELPSVAKKTRKRKRKARRTRMASATGGRKKDTPAENKPRGENAEKCETGRAMCQIPGCFLLGIEKTKEYSGKKFKKNKDELIQKIYTLLNDTVFDQKLPEKIDIAWNKKMLRTAGLCTTTEKQHPKRERYAKIEISLKVCDSADRLRDTLIHEICHAASWLIDGIRDSHGDKWKYYANKTNKIHPELPLVTRCHNYTINYKIYYECKHCKARIGRYTRSLNTERFICVACKGPLVLLPLTRKDGTPIEPHVRPFGKYVQENYRIVLQETAGISHGDVMKKLSKDYAASKLKKNP